MKKIPLSAAAAISILLTAALALSATIYPDDLSTSKVGKFPRRWRTWPLQRSKVEKVYKVGEENGQKFIRAFDDQDISQQIFINFDWPVQEKPILSWKWRATTLPEGGNESSDATNDSACGVYVVTGRYSGHAIKYAWSTGLETGKVVTRRDDKLKIKIIKTGAADKGKWVSESVNVTDDYKQLFGRGLDKNPSGIAILTDGNAVHKPAGCDYMDFAISPK